MILTIATTERTGQTAYRSRSFPIRSVMKYSNMLSAKPVKKPRIRKVDMWSHLGPAASMIRQPGSRT